MSAAAGRRPLAQCSSLLPCALCADRPGAPGVLRPRQQKAPKFYRYNLPVRSIPGGPVPRRFASVPRCLGVPFFTRICAPLLLVCLAAPAFAQAPPAPGQAVFDRQCAACHADASSSAPPRDALRQLTPEAIVNALTKIGRASCRERMV